MTITFDLPDPVAELLLRLVEHIRHHAGEEPSADVLCRSLIVDILIDDAELMAAVSASAAKSAGTRPSARLRRGMQPLRGWS